MATSSIVAKGFASRLNSRALLRVTGADGHEFLQGLFTNDLRLLAPGLSMHGCFLFFTGRVLCDAHIYHKRQQQGESSPALVIDVDASMSDELLDYLTDMKMRKKVSIENVSQEQAVEVTLHNSNNNNNKDFEAFADARNFALFSAKSSGSHADGSAPLDPHVSQLLYDENKNLVFPQLTRCLVDAQKDSPQLASSSSSSVDDYYRLLYSSGIGEGPSVFKHNKTLPFEANLDFLNGVHFNKGCYVGQELTHRTHVMLVTRKRTLPLVIPAAADNNKDGGSKSGEAPASPSVGDGLYVNGGKEKVGEITGLVGGDDKAHKDTVGVGLVRLRYVESEGHGIHGLTLQDGRSVSASIPPWWPAKQVKKMFKGTGKS